MKTFAILLVFLTAVLPVLAARAGDAPGSGEIFTGDPDPILSAEIARGEAPTATSAIAASLGHFEGTRYFADLMKALGGQGVIDFEVGDRIPPDSGRRAMLSHLLKICHPAPGENGQTLARELERTGMSRTPVLAEAVRLAPQWKPIVEEYQRPQPISRPVGQPPRAARSILDSLSGKGPVSINQIAINSRLYLQEEKGGFKIIGHFFANQDNAGNIVPRKIKWDSLTLTAPDFRMEFPARERDLAEILGKPEAMGVICQVQEPLADKVYTLKSEGMKIFSVESGKPKEQGEWTDIALNERVHPLVPPGSAGTLRAPELLVSPSDTAAPQRRDRSVPDLEKMELTAQELEKRAASLSGNARAIAQLLADRIGDLLINQPHRIDFDWRKDEYLLERIGWRDDMAIDDVFRLGDDFHQAVAALIGERNASLALRMWERASLYPCAGRFYSGETPVVQYRGGKMGCLYIRSNLEKLYAFIVGLADGFSIRSFLEEEGKKAELTRWNQMQSTGRRFRGAEYFASDLLALFLDERDMNNIVGGIEGLLEEIKDRLAARMETGKGQLEIHTLLLGLLKSRRADAHEHVAKIYRDPLLPEKYRNDIQAVANLGSLEGFVAMLRGAVGFPWTASTLAAASQWTGMVKPKFGDAFWGERGIELFYTFLSSRDRTYNRIGSRDSELAYFAMWSLAQMDVGAAVHAAGNLVRTGSRVQKADALFWAHGLANATLRGRLGLLALDDRLNRENPLVVALAMRCLDAGDNRILHRTFSASVTGQPLDRHREMAEKLFLSREELERLGAHLQEIHDALPDDENAQFGGRMWTYEDFSFFYSKKDIASFLEAVKKSGAGGN